MGLVTISPKTGDIELQTGYYMMAQFSRDIPVGATVLETKNSEINSTDGHIDGIAGIAALNPDQSRTVVIVSTRDSNTSVTVHFSRDAWTGDILPNSTTTWVLS